MVNKSLADTNLQSFFAFHFIAFNFIADVLAEHTAPKAMQLKYRTWVA